ARRRADHCQPAGPGHPDRYEFSPHTRRRAMTRPPSILIVDDHVAVRQSLAITVGNAGWQVETADNGDAALQLLAAQMFDVLLTDLWMPGIDGIALIKTCRHLQPGLVVFGMTGGGPGLSTETMLTLAEIWG